MILQSCASHVIIRNKKSWPGLRADSSMADGSSSVSAGSGCYGIPLAVIAPRRLVNRLDGVVFHKRFLIGQVSGYRKDIPRLADKALAKHVALSKRH